MSYFGTSGPSSRVAHSIAAGYQRRSNQIAARKTSPYLGNIGGIADNALGKLNQTYGRSIGFVKAGIKPYGEPSKLRDAAREFTEYYQAKHLALKNTLDISIVKRKVAEEELATVSALHAEIHAELSKDPAEINATIIATNTQEAKSVYPAYNFPGWPGINRDLKAAKDAALLQESGDQAEFDKSVKTLNTEMIEGMEDWFVEGGLVKETTARTYTTGGVIVGAVGLWLVYRWLYPPKLTTRGGNKSAAMAVFK